MVLGLSCSVECGSGSLTRDRTSVPCIGRQILNHWITNRSSSRHSCPFSKFHPRSEQYSSLSPFFFFNHRDWKQICWFIFLKRECLGLQQLESSVKESGQSWAGLPGYPWVCGAEHPYKPWEGSILPLISFHPTSLWFLPGSELFYVILHPLSLSVSLSHTHTHTPHPTSTLYSLNSLTTFPRYCSFSLFDFAWVFPRLHGV